VSKALAATGLGANVVPLVVVVHVNVVLEVVHLRKLLVALATYVRLLLVVDAPMAVKIRNDRRGINKNTKNVHVDFEVLLVLEDVGALLAYLGDVGASGGARSRGRLILV